MEKFIRHKWVNVAYILLRIIIQICRCNLEVYIFATTYQKALILGPLGVSLEFSRRQYLCNHLSESIHTWTKGTHLESKWDNLDPTLPIPLLLPYPTLPYPTLPYPTLPYLYHVPYFLLYPTPHRPAHTTYPTSPIPLPYQPTLPITYPTHNLPYPEFTQMHMTKPVGVELRCHVTALIKSTVVIKKFKNIENMFIVMV